MSTIAAITLLGGLGMFLLGIHHLTAQGRLRGKPGREEIPSDQKCGSKT